MRPRELRRRLLHLDEVVLLDPPAHMAGCEECLKIGGRWLHRRMCQSRGKVGCYDSSLNRHARAYAARLCDTEVVSSSR